MMRRVAAAIAALALLLAGCGEGGDTFDAGSGAEPEAGGWRPWVLSSPSEIEVPPPPTGAAREAEMAELAQMAASRTAESAKVVEHWGQNPPNKPWADLNAELVAAGVKDPPLASRGYALTSVAVYDAVVAAWHWKYRYNRPAPKGVDSLAPPGPDPSYPSEHAAIAGAASRVIEYLFPDRPALRLEQLAEEAAESRVLAGANYRSDVEAGLALGRAVGDAVVARARTDGVDRAWDGTRPPGIGGGPEFWEPRPGTVAPPVQPLAGTWRTWVLSSGSQFRPPPPHPYGSPEFVAECVEVMEVTANLTQEQKDIATFWAGGQGTALPPGLWQQITMTYVQATRLSTPRSARAFALLNVAQADAGTAVWDAKFTYWSPRPENAIRDSGMDPGWKPFLVTPPFPSYVSGHSGYSAASAEVLAYLFPGGAEEFRAKAREAADSRLYGGIHYRSDNDAGIGIGLEVGRLVVERARDDGAG